MAFGLGEIYYGLEAPVDGATQLLAQYLTAEKTPGYNIPRIYSGILREKSKQLFETYVTLHPPSGLRAFVEQLLEEEEEKKNP